MDYCDVIILVGAVVISLQAYIIHKMR